MAKYGSLIFDEIRHSKRINYIIEDRLKKNKAEEAERKRLEDQMTAQEKEDEARANADE